MLIASLAKSLPGNISVLPSVSIRHDTGQGTVLECESHQSALLACALQDKTKEASGIVAEKAVVVKDKVSDAAVQAKDSVEDAFSSGSSQAKQQAEQAKRHAEQKRQKAEAEQQQQQAEAQQRKKKQKKKFGLF